MSETAIETAPRRREHALLEPFDEHNRRTVQNVHPDGWVNPEPSGRYNLVVLGAGTAGLVSAIGAGPIGVELSQAFARFGAEVHLLEAADQILVREDPDAAARVEKALRRDGVRIVSGCRITRVWSGAGDSASSSSAAARAAASPSTKFSWEWAGRPEGGWRGRGAERGGDRRTGEDSMADSSDRRHECKSA